jgi:hypothetical protein
MDIAIAVSAATRAVVSSSAEVMVPDYGPRCRPPTGAGVWTLCLEGGSDDCGGARRGLARRWWRVDHADIVCLNGV